jgi:hypothetical protein
VKHWNPLAFMIHNEDKMKFTPTKYDKAYVIHNFTNNISLDCQVRRASIRKRSSKGHQKNKKRRKNAGSHTQHPSSSAMLIIKNPLFHPTALSLPPLILSRNVKLSLQDATHSFFSCRAPRMTRCDAELYDCEFER